MDPAQFNPPLPYDRYVNRELPILPRSSSSQSISHGFFEDSPQCASSHDLPQHGAGVSSNMAADPFSPQFEKPTRLSSRQVLPWMGTGSEHGLVDLPLPDCGQVDPMMGGMMVPQPLSPVRGVNGNSLAVDKVLSAVSSRDKNAPTTIRSWTLTRQSTVTQRKPCWTDCRACQYIGLFVFVGVLAVIGYAVYNGVIAAIVHNKTTEQGSNRGNATYWTTTLASNAATNGSPVVSTTTIASTTSTTTLIPSTVTTTKKLTTTAAVLTTKRKKKKKSKYKPTKTTTTTTTTTTTATPVSTTPSKTKKAAKPVRKVRKESPYCSYPIGRLMRTVTKDDRRCADSSKGIYATDGSCTKFHVCYTGGRLLAAGTCPCGRIFDEETRKCMKQKRGYYRHPYDCERYSRCTHILSSVMRISLRCNVGLAFDIRPKTPVCTDAKDVPGCTTS